MTDLRNQRRVSATILKCGENRVWMDPDRTEEIAKAVTRDDVKLLIKGKAIVSKQKKGISTGRKKYAKKQKDKGRQRGHGSRKGAKYARLPRKERWIIRIRPIRSHLRELRNSKQITPSVYRLYYRRAKGGEFNSKRHLHSHLVADGKIKEGQS